MLFVTAFARTGKDHRGAAGPEYVGIRYRHSVTSGRRGSVWSAGLAFSDLSIALRRRERLAQC